MGEVYRARDPRIGREVAIKILPSTFSENPDRLRRFQQEARAAGLLNHPNILAIYDVGTEKSSLYLVSELLEGETLRQKLRTATLSARRTIEYATREDFRLRSGQVGMNSHRGELRVRREKQFEWLVFTDGENLVGSNVF